MSLLYPSGADINGGNGGEAFVFGMQTRLRRKNMRMLLKYCKL